MVPQNIHLFDGNIIDNITIGSSNVNMEKVLKVCKSLEIMQFIENLPQGFYTQLGENGASLSGGQKQRIAIARALYQEPQVLILDEASASLDSRSDYVLQKTLTGLRENGKTVILVSHRLLNLSFVDTIVVLEGGKLVQQGSHDKLILKNGSYKTLWKKQFPQSSKVI